MPSIAAYHAFVAYDLALHSRPRHEVIREWTGPIARLTAAVAGLVQAARPGRRRVVEPSRTSAA